MLGLEKREDSKKRKVTRKESLLCSLSTSFLVFSKVLSIWRILNIQRRKHASSYPLM